MIDSSARSRLPIVVLISGNGSNLQAIIDAAAGADLPVDIRAVISNRADAFGLQRARRARLPTETIDQHAYPDRECYDQALQSLIDSYQPGLVVLAGYMRILGSAIVARYEGRMLNIHPSLLPSFRGLHTHERAIAAKVKEHGASVHFVTRELDGGPVIIQARVPVYPDDDADHLAARVLTVEHKIYPLAIRWYAEGRLRMHYGQVCMDGKPLHRPIDLHQIQ